MAPSTTAYRAAQPLFRQAASTARPAFRPQHLHQQFRQHGRRWQSTASETQQSWFKKAWESEVGIRTVHFWYVWRLCRGSSLQTLPPPLLFLR